MDKKTLVIITDSFPFGQGETFLADELIYLSYEFEHIYLIPSFISKNSIAREIPLNCTIESFFADRIQLFCAPKALLKKGLRLNLLWNELTNTQVLWFIKNFKAINVLATKAIFEAGILGSWIQNRVKEPYLLYSYWFSEPAAACAVLKQRKVVSLWISGTHGYDLYDERHPLKKQPFRSFKIKYNSSRKSG